MSVEGIPTSSGRESVDCIALAGPLVPATPDGAQSLGRWYWDELERTSRGLLRARTEPDGIRLVLGRSVTLLRFGNGEVELGAGTVACRYPIVGGALVSDPGGSLTIAQRDGAVPQLEVTVQGYRPSLVHRGARLHRGIFYRVLQAPLHRSVSRRFLARTARRVS